MPQTIHFFKSDDMSLHLNPLHAELAVEVSGIDLRKPLGKETLAELQSALARYPV